LTSFLKNFIVTFVYCAIVLVLLHGCKNEDKVVSSNNDHKTWFSYLGDSGRSHFSSLSQVTKENQIIAFALE